MNWRNPIKAVIECREVMDDVCSHVMSSEASRDRAVNLETDSY